jgi:hypothetical protein
MGSAVELTTAIQNHNKENRTMRTCIKLCCAAIAIVALSGVASMAFANPLGGPISGVSRAPAYGATVHMIVYRGGEQADFKIKGDGDTTLNVVVRDANGFEIVRTRGPGDDCRVTWRPCTTGVFYISVVNEGCVYNQYQWLAF